MFELNMREKGAPLPGAVRAIGTGVRLLPAVDHVVVAEMVLMAKHSLTNGAAETPVRRLDLELGKRNDGGG